MPVLSTGLMQLPIVKLKRSCLSLLVWILYKTDITDYSIVLCANRWSSDGIFTAVMNHLSILPMIEPEPRISVAGNMADVINRTANKISWQKQERGKKNISEIKEAVDDKEEQLAYLATLIRVIVL